KNGMFALAKNTLLRRTNSSSLNNIYVWAELDRPCYAEARERRRTACIVGWAHSQFGKLSDETVESLIVKVTDDAVEHAGIGPEDVDEIVLGHFNAGFSAQDFTASLVLQADDRLRFKPATRVENACATGSAAVRQGIRALEARAARVVLVVGVEQMTTT